MSSQSTSSQPPPKPRVTPVNAASLVIIRGQGGGAEVLMGRRRPRASFMPNVYVFPGGRVDKEDSFPPSGVRLRPTVEDKMKRRCKSTPAAALALAALRETYEETGLLLCGEAGRQPIETSTPLWQAYGAAGLTPDLGKFDYIARAITPPGLHRRFNTRFFVTRGDDAVGDLLQDGELLDLQWIRLTDVVSKLNVVDVTAFVLTEASINMSLSPKAIVQRPTILMCYSKNKRRFYHE